MVWLAKKSADFGAFQFGPLDDCDLDKSPNWQVGTPADVWVLWFSSSSGCVDVCKFLIFQSRLRVAHFRWRIQSAHCQPSDNFHKPFTTFFFIMHRKEDVENV